MNLDINRIRGQFPALDRPSVFFDNPGGTQIARPALDRMHDYLVNSNANRDGAFSTSYESDAILEESRQAVADFFNAARARWGLRLIWLRRFCCWGPSGRKASFPPSWATGRHHLGLPWWRICSAPS